MKKLFILGALLVGSLLFGQTPTFFKDTERNISIEATPKVWYKRTTSKGTFISYNTDTKPENYIDIMKETAALLTYYGFNEDNADLDKSYNQTYNDRIENYKDLTSKEVNDIVTNYLLEESNVTKVYNLPTMDIVLIRNKEYMFISIQLKIKPSIKKK